MLKLVVQPVGQRLPAIGLLGLAAVEICLLVEDATKYGLNPTYCVFMGILITGNAVVGWRTLRAGLLIKDGDIHVLDLLRHRIVPISSFVAIRQGDWALGKRLFVITETGRFKVPFSSTSGMNPQFVERRMAKWAAERTDDIQQMRDGHSAP